MAVSYKYTLQKTKLIGITVAVSLALISWQSIGQRIPLSFQLMFLATCLLLTGIPHGALDHLVQQEQSRRQNSRFRLLVFLVRYLAIMLLYAAAWYGFPQLSLLFFLLISCWHFGETDIDQMPQNQLLTTLLRLLYGISVLSWILLAHYTEVSPILMDIVGHKSLFYSQWIMIAAQSSWLVPVSGAITFVLLVFSLIVTKSNRYRYWLALQLVIILLCGYYLPLLLAFALYFAGWHSLITLFNIEGFITTADINPNKPLLIVWLKALPFSFIAIAGLVASGYLLRQYAPLFNPLPLLFVFLSLITLPHMEVMHKLNSSLSD